MIQHIGLLTSGGDAPGMNAAIRAVVLACHHYGIKVTGFKHGYNGLIENEFTSLNEADVRHIIHTGGTLLKSARCPEFQTQEGLVKATKTLNDHAIDCLIVIGGDGSFKGLLALNKVWKGQLIGIPGTIDNDVDGTDFTIGFSTAVNTGIDAIDKIRDTADAFERIFLVEVMGRHSGFIAMNVGIATGAEQVLTFETHEGNDKTLDTIITHVNSYKSKRGNASYIIVIAENLWPSGIYGLANALREKANIDCQPCVLGHIQRGGKPVAKDRVLATRLGVKAVEAAVNHETMVMFGELDNSIVAVPLAEAVLHTKQVNAELIYAQNNVLDIAKISEQHNF